MIFGFVAIMLKCGWVATKKFFTSLPPCRRSFHKRPNSVFDRSLGGFRMVRDG